MKRLLLMGISLLLLPRPSLAETGHFGTSKEYIVRFVLKASEEDRLIRAWRVKYFRSCQTYADPEVGECNGIQTILPKEWKKNYKKLFNH